MQSVEDHDWKVESDLNRVSLFPATRWRVRSWFRHLVAIRQLGCAVLYLNFLCILRICWGSPGMLCSGLPFHDSSLLHYEPLRLRAGNLTTSEHSKTRDLPCTHWTLLGRCFLNPEIYSPGIKNREVARPITSYSVYRNSITRLGW